MIYVFKTSVDNQQAIEVLKPKLDELIPGAKWNFDLHDCDNILRIDSHEISSAQVIALLNAQQFECVELE